MNKRGTNGRYTTTKRVIANKKACTCKAAKASKKAKAR